MFLKAFLNKKKLIEGCKDPITQKRAHFVYYLISIGICGCVIALTSIILQGKYAQNLDFQLPVFICISLVFFIFLVAAYFMTKKKLRSTGNIIFYGVVSVLWGTILLGETIPPLSRLNTFFYMLTALTMLPLIIDNEKKVVSFWIANIVMLLVVFAKIHYFEDNTLEVSTIYDTFVDGFLSISFGSVAIYSVFSINEMAVKSANDEIKRREAIAVELESHKNNLEKLVEEQTVSLKKAYLDIKASHDKLRDQNKLINIKNDELNNTLSHLKQTKSKLIQSYKMASLGVLTSGIAHEINNPLNYIKGAHTGLNDCLKVLELNKEDKENINFLLDSINVGLEKTEDIVDGLNQFSRTNKRNDELCNIHNILNNCLNILKYQYKYKIEITTTYNADSPFIKGNNGRLHQVFNNIIQNGIQAIEANGKIDIFTQNNDNTISIVIKDSGTGISHEHISQITDPFFTTKEPGKGTGLGLSISYSIVEEHKGSLHFESELNTGTTVTITFPTYNQIN